MRLSGSRARSALVTSGGNYRDESRRQRNPEGEEKEKVKKRKKEKSNFGKKEREGKFKVAFLQIVKELLEILLRLGLVFVFWFLYFFKIATMRGIVTTCMFQ